MKARIKATDNLWFDVEAEQEDDLFKQIAQDKSFFKSLFEIIKCCKLFLNFLFNGFSVV